MERERNSLLSGVNSESLSRRWELRGACDVVFNLRSRGAGTPGVSQMASKETDVGNWGVGKPVL